MAYYQLPNGQVVPDSQVRQDEFGRWSYLDNPTSPEGGWVSLMDQRTGDFGTPVATDEPYSNRYADFSGYDSYDLMRADPRFTADKVLYDYGSDKGFLDDVLPKSGKTLDDLYKAQYGDITSGRFQGQNAYIGPVERRAQYAHSLGIDPSAWGLTPGLRQQTQTTAANTYDAEKSRMDNDPFGSLGEGLKVAGLVAGGIGMLPGVAGLGATIGSALPSMPSWATSLPPWAQTAIKSGGLNALKAGLTGGDIGSAAISGAMTGGAGTALSGAGSLFSGGGEWIDPRYTAEAGGYGEDYGDVGLDYSNAPGSSDFWQRVLGAGGSAVKSLLGVGAGSALGGRGGISGGYGPNGGVIDSGAAALNAHRKAIETDEGKYPSPIKPYLTPQMLSTGALQQVPELFKGFDPKFSAQMASRGYPVGGQSLADGGQVEPSEYVPGPEGRYYARHAKRGFAVNGPGTGQSDDIPTMLADGEYVIDSDTVAALGDGSSKAGASVLDKFRKEIRKHKRAAPIDDIPPKSKSPLAYLKAAQKGNKK